MADNAYPVLCGGTFFTLLLEARQQRTSRRSQYQGEQDGLSQPDVLAGLGKVVYPEYATPANRQSFSTNATAYKSCANNGDSLSFLFPDRVTSFDERVRNNYPMALKAMCEFVDRFLEVSTSINKETWLAKALLELIEQDQSIAGEQEFLICAGGQGITKEIICTMSDFVLQPLLLGIWHFVITSRPNNKLGKDTFDIWCPPKGRAVRKYEGDMGNRIMREINVEVLTMPEDEPKPENSSVASIEPETIEAPMTESDADPKRITVNNYGTVQNQKFISVETMNGDINL